MDRPQLTYIHTLECHFIQTWASQSMKYLRIIVLQQYNKEKNNTNHHYNIYMYVRTYKKISNEMKILLA